MKMATQEEQKKELAKRYSYEFAYWLPKMQSFPTEEREHCDRSAGYETDTIHVFKLEDGNYAVVTESGCSCYGADEAEIEVFSKEEEAIQLYEKWEHEHNDSSYGEECSCGKHKKTEATR